MACQMAPRSLLRVARTSSTPLRVTRTQTQSQWLPQSSCRSSSALLQHRRPAFRTFSSAIPLREKKYTEDHEWVELADDGKTGTIGITSYAAHQLGDVVFVELPALDLEVGAGDSIGAVESVKSAADINTPVSGTVVEANDALQGTPSTINKAPEGDGWIAKILVKDVKELERLMDRKGYEEFTTE